MSRAWTITTGSRLHFGPLAWKPSRGPDFGGWGVMLETPRTVVRVGENVVIPTRRPSQSQSRASGMLHQLLQKRPELQSFALNVAVDEEPPAHCGFGSGTQLALAVAAGLVSSTDGERLPATTLAAMVGRGLRSAVGIHGFDLGGLIIDAGKRPEDAIGVLADHVPVPADWRFVLIRPASATGLAGEKEVAAFNELPPFSDHVTQRLRAIVFDEVLPATRENDCSRFAAALDDYGLLVGEAFAAAQGGVVHVAAMPIWSGLRSRGIRGVAQTSWGPTLAAVCADPDEAEHVAAIARDFGPEIAVTVTSARNRGAEVEAN